MSEQQISITIQDKWSVVGDFFDKEVPLWAAIIMVILAILPQLGAWLLKWKHGVGDKNDASGA